MTSKMTLSVRDDRGRRLRFTMPPQRIVSLVPSDTYTLIKLGAATKLVGRTRYCIAPEPEVDRIEIVGGAKDASIARIIGLTPDLVVANQEDNSRADIEALEQAGLTVLLSFPQTVAAGLAHAERLAQLLPELQAETQPVLSAAQARLAAFTRGHVDPVRTFVPIWFEPVMTATRHTVLSDMLRLCGAQNVFADFPTASSAPSGRYPQVELSEIAARQPELVLLPDEPFPFSEQQAAVFRRLPQPEPQALLCPQVMFCDGKDLVWYGLRCIEALDRLSALVRGVRQS